MVVVLLLNFNDPHICALLLEFRSSTRKFGGLGHFAVVSPVKPDVVFLFPLDLRVFLLVRLARRRYDVYLLEFCCVRSDRILLLGRVDEGVLLSNRAESF